MVERWVELQQKKNSGWYIANLNKHISGFLVVAPPGMICCTMQKV